MASRISLSKNSKKIFGKPDIVFIREKVAVFCDSEFWHGFDWEHNKNEINSGPDFWIEKIERTMQRDMKVTNYLEENGWIVLRFWGNDIKNNLIKCADTVERTITHK